MHLEERLPEPDALTDFLTGRWNAYTYRAGRLWRVPIEHEPWPLHAARAEGDASGLLRAGGLPRFEVPPLTHASPLVHLRLGAPRPVRAGAGGRAV